MNLDSIRKKYYEAQYWSQSELDSYQNTALTRVLRRASSRVPFYRDLYQRSGIDLESITDVRKLWKIPSVVKDDFLRVGPQEFLSQDFDKSQLKASTTSGSLGRALTHYKNTSESHNALVGFWSAFWTRGLTKGDRVLLLAAPYFDIFPSGLICEYMTVQATAEQIRQCFLKLQPTAIIGATEAIALLAKDLHDLDIKKRSSVKRIFPFGQTLGDSLKSMIQLGFDAEIFDSYGCSEIGWIGIECGSHSGLHVPGERVIVQISKLGKPDEPAQAGELGEVILTSLEQNAMPFIRYRIGDVARWENTPCSCGRNGARLVSLEGRVQDLLLSTQGNLISPGAIQTDLAYGQDDIDDLRVIQVAQNQVQVFLVLKSDLQESLVSHVNEVFTRQLGEVDVSIDLVDEVPRDPSGKRRRVYRAF